MIYGIVGTISQTRNIGIPRPSDCGNGKTNLMVYLAYQEFIQKGRKVITNFHTRYMGGNWGYSWSEFRTAQEIFEMFFAEENEDALICISEISGILHSAARESKTIKWVENRLNQRRKLGYDLIWDSQRWMSGDKIIRDKTDIIYVPIKFHCVFDMKINNYVPTKQCFADNCDEKHLILIYQDVPLPPPEEELIPLLCLQSWVIGELYDTKERIDQTLHAPKESV
jgi:hypothetical protein